MSNNILQSRLQTQLEQQHYAPIALPLSAEQLTASANAFLKFLALPDNIKRQLHFAARSHRASADGFTDKTTVHSKDPKQFFHWSPTLMTQPACQTLRESEPTIAAFFDQAVMIYQQIEIVLVALFKKELKPYKDLVIKDDKLIDGILRFLSYAPQAEQNFCAQAHFDKGFSTLAIADSAPGLRIGCCNDHPLKQVEHQTGTALFMPAWMLFEASGGEIKPAWHDVIHAPNQQNVTPYCARWSIVFFMNSPSTPFSSWEAVHTPLH